MCLDRGCYGLVQLVSEPLLYASTYVLIELTKTPSGFAALTRFFLPDAGCAPGYGLLNASSTVCELCPANTFSLGATSSANKFPLCRACADGTSSTPGSPICQRRECRPCRVCDGRGACVLAHTSGLPLTGRHVGSRGERGPTAVHGVKCMHLERPVLCTYVKPRHPSLPHGHTTSTCLYPWP